MVVCRCYFDDVCAAVGKSGRVGTEDTRMYMMLSPAKPRRMRFTSRVVHPPASGVPVAGASPGSIDGGAGRGARSASTRPERHAGRLADDIDIEAVKRC